MSEVEEEYEVESILKAKVVKKKGNKFWLFWVKWKNYDIKDNTWEPAESFNNGSEHFMEHFWGRVDVNDRDVNDLSQFAIEEEVFPSGPPRRKKVHKKAKPPPPAQNPDSETEVRSLIGDEVPMQGKKRRSPITSAPSQAPLKRKRARVSESTRVETIDLTSPERPLTRKRSMPELTTQSWSTRNNAADSSSSRHASGTRFSPGGRRDKITKRRKVSRIVSSPDELSLLPEKSERGTKSMPVTEDLVECRATVSSPHGSLFSDGDEGIMDQDVPPTDPPSPFGVPTLLEPKLPSPPLAPPSMPVHRARAANPKVKIVDDPFLPGALDGALAVKARLIRQRISTNNDMAQSSPSSSRATKEPSSSRPVARISSTRAGPGRSSSNMRVESSLLVAQNGKLTTLGRKSTNIVADRVQQRGVYREHATSSILEVRGIGDEVPGLGLRGLEQLAPVSVPTGEELLQAAGFDAAAAADLPDFQDDAEGSVDPDTRRSHSVHSVTAIEQVEKQVNELPPDNLVSGTNGGINESMKDGNSEQLAQGIGIKAQEGVGEKTVSTVSTFASVSNTVKAAWKQSTIFGPFGLGLDRLPSVQETAGQSSLTSAKHALFLNLDSSVSLPTNLKDPHPSDSFSGLLNKSMKGAPGKFYKEQYALLMLDTLKAKGSYGRLTLEDGADESQRKHFERFKSRLESGELFVQMNGAELLVMCSAASSTVGQVLRFPAALLGLGDSVLVAHVGIENPSAYADATVHADDARW